MKCLLIMSAAAKGNQVYRSFCQPVCKAFDLSPTAFDVMLFLANHPEHNTARDVCRIRGIKSGIVSVTVEQLILRGLLLRETDLRDRRIQRLRPTPAAEPLIAAGRQAQQRFEAAIMSALTPEEYEEYARLTGKLMDHVDRLAKHQESGVSVC